MSSKTTSSQESKPPAWAAPLFEQSASEAQNLYNSGAGGNPYMGSTIADLSDTTMGGVNQLAQAGQGWNTSGTRPLFQGIGQASVGPSYSEQNLAGIASGADNPYFEQALEGQLGKTADQVQSRMSGAGRYGSGAHTGVMTGELGNIRSNALSNQWNQNIQNMFGANSLMDSNRNAGLDRGLQSAGAMANMDQQQFQNALTGAGATLQAGGILDDQANRMAMEEANRFYEMDNAGWNRLGLLQSAAAGAAGPYGSQSGTSRTSNPGAILSGIGGMMGGK